MPKITADSMTRNGAGPRLACHYLVALAVLVTAGCGPASDLPPLAPVYGKITVGGQPLTFGSVSLIPDRSKGTQGTMGVGVVHQDGSFRIVTAGEDGGLVGHHLIRVRAEIEFDPTTGTPPHSVVHDRYAIAKESGLTLEVKANEDNVFDMALDPPE
jgi:hypothetical protein